MSLAGLWRLAAGYLFGTFDYTNLNLTEILPKIVTGPDLAMWGPWALFIAGALIEQAWLN